MSENTVLDLDYLPRDQRLLRLSGPETPIIINKNEAAMWRYAFLKVYKTEEGKDMRFIIKTSKKDKITRVIKLK